MLLSINENCLVRICDFLPVEDQISLSRCCEYLQDFFVNNLWIWKGRLICLNLNSPFWDLSENDRYFPTFIRLMSPSVRKITLQSMHIEKHGDLLMELKFPKLKVCEAIIFEDDEMLKITQMFPDLKELSVDGFCSGKHILELKELEILCLAPRVNTLLNYFSQIYSLPKLKKITFVNKTGCSSSVSDAITLAQNCWTLEEIGFNERVGSTDLKTLKKIKNLRIINVRASLMSCKIYRQMNSVLKRLENIFLEALDTLVIHKMNIFQLELGTMLKLKHLRSMIIFETFLGDKDLEDLCYNLPPTLEEFFYLYSSSQLENYATHFLPLIKNCLKLTLFDVSGNRITSNFVKDIAKAVIKQNRKKPLILRCFQTEVTEESLQKLKISKNLLVSFSKGCYNFNESNFAHFQLHLDRSKIKEEEIPEGIEYADEYGYLNYDEDYFSAEDDFEDYSVHDLGYHGLINWNLTQ